MKSETKDNKTHHEFPPSSLALFAKSPCFVPSSEGGEAAERGTLQHACAESDEAPEWEQLTEEEGLEVDWATTISDPLVYAKAVRERKVVIAGGATEGTPDVVYFFDYNQARLVDYKFGSVPVTDPAQNWQIRAYCLGVMEANPDLFGIQACIVQPKLNKMAVAHFTREELEEWRPTLQRLIAKAKDARENGWKTPSLDACKYCKIRGECSRVIEEAAERAVEVAPSLKDKIDPEFATEEELLSLALQWREVLTRKGGWADRVRDRAVELNEKGVEIPGVKFSTARGRASIEDMEAARLALKGLVTKEDFQAACKVSFEALNNAVKKPDKFKTKRALQEEIRRRLEEAKVLSYAPDTVRLTLEDKPALLALPDKRKGKRERGFQLGLDKDAVVAKIKTKN